MDRYEDESENRSRASKLLSELKNIEKNTKFHAKRISKNTVVMCKNEDRIKMFENSIRIN